MRILILSILMLFTGAVSAQKYWNSTVKFDGKTHISFWDPFLNSKTDYLSVEFWVKTARDTQSCTILGNQQIWILTHSGKIRVQANGGTQMFSKKVLEKNQWTHVAVTFDGGTARAAKLYINGSLDTTTSFSAGTLYAVSDSFYIGKKYFSYFVGELDEIRMWRGVRSADEILNNMRTHISAYEYDKLDDSDIPVYIQTFETQTPNPGLGLPANQRVSGTLSANPIGLKPSQTVRHNTGIYFPGTSWGYIQSSSPNDPNVSFTGQITLEAWICPIAFDTRMVIMSLNNGGGGFELSIVANAQLNFTFPPQGTTVAGTLLPNTWYHVAVVGETPSGGMQTAKIYVNGVLVNTSSHNEMWLNSNKLRIGASHSNSDYFKGFMDEIRISNYAKTEAEIRQNMYNPILYHNQPASPKTTVAYNFDGGLYSSTGKGFTLENANNCRFSYFNETSAPVFCLGDNHSAVMNNFTISHRSVFVPVYGNTDGVVTDTITINKAVKIDPNKFKVFLSLTHYRLSDLKVELVSPTGETVELINQLTNIPSNQMTLVLDTQKLNKINSNAFIDHAPLIGFNGSYNAFNGKNSKGIWTLKVSDLKLGATGRLHGWGISVDGEAIVTNNTYNAKAGNLIVYPNPSEDGKTFTIKPKEQMSGTARVTLFDLNGRKVFDSEIQSALGEFKIQMDKTLASGCYFVKLVNANSSYTAKLKVN